MTKMARLNQRVRRSWSLGLVFLVLVTPTYGQAPSKKPISKQGLLEAVRLNGLTTRELIERVEQRGVSFQMAPRDESEFQAAGARPELIEAIRQNYRAAEPAPSTGGVRPPVKPAGNVPPGPPLSKNEIVTMLQGGIAPSRVEQFVEARGVSFAVSPEITREIMSAGGNRSLLGAIAERANSPAPAKSSGSGNVSASSAPDYDDLTEQATAAMLASNPAQALRYAQEAIRMDPTRSTGYQLLGYTQLYGFRDPGSAEMSMRAAIERGGTAVFRVYHDHDGFFKQFCQGSMFISKSAVTFKADDGNHTFEAQDTEIKEVKTNAFVGSEYGAFHIKVERAGEKSKNYNFAPWMTKQVESNIIIRLVKNY